MSAQKWEPSEFRRIRVENFRSSRMQRNFITVRIHSDTSQCNKSKGAHSKDVHAMEIGNTASSLTRTLNRDSIKSAHWRYS